MQLNKIALALFGTTVFVACAYYLYSRFSWAAGVAVFLSADLRWLIGGGGLCYIVYLMLRSLRWQVLTRDKGFRSGFLFAYFLTAITQGLAMVTPAQLGEALKIELAKRHGNLGRWPGSAAYVAERIMDMAILGSISLIGLAAYGRAIEMVGLNAPIALIGVVVLLGIAVFVFFRDAAGTTGLRRKFRDAFPTPLVLARASALSLLSWLLVALSWQFALISVGVVLTVAQSMWLVAVVAIAQFASLIPGGVGAADVAAVELLQLWGNDPTKALAGALALRAMGLLMIGIALLHWGAWTLFGSSIRSSAAERRHAG